MSRAVDSFCEIFLFSGKIIPPNVGGIFLFLYIFGVFLFCLEEHKHNDADDRNYKHEKTDDYPCELTYGKPHKGIQPRYFIFYLFVRLNVAAEIRRHTVGDYRVFIFSRDAYRDSIIGSFFDGSKKEGRNAAFIDDYRLNSAEILSVLFVKSCCFSGMIFGKRNFRRESETDIAVEGDLITFAVAYRFLFGFGRRRIFLYLIRKVDIARNFIFFER